MHHLVSSEEPAEYRVKGQEPDLEKIVSGGQTGVDRAALDAAIDIGFAVGGWCPEGRLAEDGTIPDRYPLKELAGASYRQRTLKNVQDSDVTLILYHERPSGGTEQTLAFCIKEKKPYLLIDVEAIPVAKAVRKLEHMLRQGLGKVLNVAGPRASTAPWAYAYTYELISSLLKRAGTKGVEKS